MTYLALLAEGSNPFQFHWFTLTWYMINFIILFVALYLLLFKPIKKFIQKRNEHLVKIIEENKALESDVKKSQAMYDNLISEAKQELAKANEKATILAKEKSDEIIKSANLEAEQIVKKAIIETQNQKVRLEKEIREQIASLSIIVAEKILQKEITQQDNSAIVEQSLKEFLSADNN